MDGITSLVPYLFSLPACFFFVRLSWMGWVTVVVVCGWMDEERWDEYGWVVWMDGLSDKEGYEVVALAPQNTPNC